MTIFFRSLVFQRGGGRAKTPSTKSKTPSTASKRIRFTVKDELDGDNNGDDGELRSINGADGEEQLSLTISSSKPRKQRARKPTEKMTAAERLKQQILNGMGGDLSLDGEEESAFAGDGGDDSAAMDVDYGSESAAMAAGVVTESAAVSSSPSSSTAPPAPPSETTYSDTTTYL